MPFKVAVIGDTHFGFAYGTERADDCYEQARRAMAAALAGKPDVILLTGDVFDSPIPRQETMAKGAAVLSSAAKAEDSAVKLVEPSQHLPLKGVPIVAIHGTHERRPKGLTNPLHVLANAGVLIYLQNSTAVFEKDGEKLAIFGLGGVPEAYALDVLRAVKPAPRQGARNIFLFHQSVKPYVFTAEGEGVELADLPKGFDLYVDGHIHWGFVEPAPQGGVALFAGSTLVTQVRKNEAEGPPVPVNGFRPQAQQQRAEGPQRRTGGVDKSVWMAELGAGAETRIRKIEFPSVRKIFLLEPKGGLEELAEELRKLPAGLPKPLVRAKLPASSAAEDASGLMAEFSGKMILSIERGQEKGKQSSLSTTLPPASPAEAVKSVDERALEFLSKLMKEKAPPRLEEIYSLLCAGKAEEVKEMLASP